MTKQLFIMAMNAIQKQEEADYQFAKSMQVCFPQACTVNLRIESNFLFDALITIMREQMHDNDDIMTNWGTWTDWWIYETEFGKKAKAHERDGRRIPMETAGDLWEFLNREKQKSKTTKQQNK